MGIASIEQRKGAPRNLPSADPKVCLQSGNQEGWELSFMCVAADRLGERGGKTHNRNNAFRYISSFHQEISEHILVFSTQFSHTSVKCVAFPSFVSGKQIDV